MYGGTAEVPGSGGQLQRPEMVLLVQHLDDVVLRGYHPGFTLGAGYEVVLDSPRARLLRPTVVFLLFLV